ncbi:hypothetical protein NHJ6243_008465 [Beauveria neobassiana]
MAAPKPPGSKLSTMDLRATETGDTKDVATVGRLRDTEMDGMEDVATAEHGSNIQNISSAMKLVLETLGEDTSRDGLRKTPERFAKAIVSLTSGYNLNPVNILKDAIFEEDCHDLVVVKDISFSSLCEHHLLPFFGKAHIGYIPNGRVVGLSKPARVVNVFAKRLQLQERLTKQVAQCLFDVVQPRGVAVAIESTHMCMAMRGVEKIGSSTMTTCFLGEFEKVGDAREEFWRALGK